MEIEQILTKIYSQALHKRGRPGSSDPEIQSAIKESQRKIGSWRKVLWLCGIIRESRINTLPQLSFTADGNTVRLDKASEHTLLKLCPPQQGKKRRML